jgi:hypothetical protein
LEELAELQLTLHQSLTQQKFNAALAPKLSSINVW